MPEPVAAAGYGAAGGVGIGEHLAPYDLGGGGVQTAVLGRTEDGFELIAPGGRDDVGGEGFDSLLYYHVGRQLPQRDSQALCESQEPAWARARSQLLEGCRNAKERLSGEFECEVLIPPPVEREVTVTRSEFEMLIGEQIDASISELERTIQDAGVSAEGWLGGISLVEDRAGSLLSGR